MKLKRNIFAFLIMGFILSGCMSEVAVPQNDVLQSNLGAIPAQAQLMSKEYEGLGGIQFMSAKLDGASMKHEIQNYAANENADRDTSKDALLSSLKVIAESSDVAQYKVKKTVAPVTSKSVSAGDVMNPRMTFYGVDCHGCNVRNGRGNTATGVTLDINDGVLQSNGTWVPGITYDGYYIVAADKSIPVYSIIEISNHGISGMGISPNTPIKAIVLDRGGGVNGAHLDLYIGSESFIPRMSQSRTTPEAKIIRYGR